jgi:hypothetical protein
MVFPKSCLRGIPNSTFVTEEGIPSSSLFFPMNNSLEVSINWEDDNQVLAFTLAMKKGEEFQFDYGVVRLPVKGMDDVCNKCILKNPIIYVRAPITGNTYHGNIKYREDLSKDAKKMVAGMLALKVSNIIRR